MKKSTANILIAFILNFFFVIIELVGGLLTNSIAILSDSIHDLGDCIALGAAFFLEKKSEKKPDKNYTYGYKRYSLISALVTNSILLIGGAIVIYSSIQRIINPEVTNGIGMVIIAVFGVIINGLAVFKTSKSENLNEKSINLHMLEDVLGWLVVLVGSIIITIFGITIIDPIMSILVTFFIFYNVIKNIISVNNVLLEKTPKNFKTTEYTACLTNIKNVKNVHHMHIWSLDGEILLGTLHVIVANNISLDDLQTVKNEIQEQSIKFNVRHLTIQIDRECENCKDGCCQINN